MNWRRLVRHLLGVLPLMILLAACGQDTAGQDAADDEAPTEEPEDAKAEEASEEVAEEGCQEYHEVTLGFQTTGTITVVHAAEQEGFNEEQCLIVHTEVLESAPLIQAALERGDIDILHGITSAGHAAREQGAEMVAVLQSESAREEPPDSYALMVPPDGSIASVEDLESLNVGTAKLGRQATINMILVLEEHGLG